MSNRSLLACLMITLSGLLVPALLPAEEKASEAFAAADLEFFESKVRPVLQTHCVKCHGGEAKIRGGLRLTNRAAVLKGGDSGPAVNLDDVANSPLLEAINYRSFEMPPSGKLPAEQIEILTQWVKKGLPWTPGKSFEQASADGEHKKAAPTIEEGKRHWSFQPIQRPRLPTVKREAWISNPIDLFVLERLEAAGLEPAAPAESSALVRRLHYDLTGLPPPPELVDRLVADPSDSAYERMVDDLLDSPHYGEKWGRHWLDLVHFAESNGYERDGPKPFAWRYRDYVIRSLNEDKPFDQFIREQLAGDELAEPTGDSIIATGFFRLGLWDDEPVDPLQARWDDLDDYITTTSQVFLGLTMNCCRCHDHKLDPLPQADYYRMAAFFRDVSPFSDSRNVSSRFNLTDISPPEAKAKYERELREREGNKARLIAQMRKIEDAAIAKMSAEDREAAATNDRPAVVERKLKEFTTADQFAEHAELKKQVQQIEKQPDPHRELALSVNHATVKPEETFVLIRGNAHAHGAKVEPGYPEVLGFAAPMIPGVRADAKSSGRRTVLANWIASRENPLTARVIANRLWQYHFGRGLVRSTNNFGFGGDRPTHPELLDWLASELLEEGWKLKGLHKRILMSSTYRQSNAMSPPAYDKDPANDLHWRYDARRLSAEEMRDSMLWVSGQLNPKMGGPSIYPEIPKEVLAGQSRPGENWGRSSPEEASRRSVYIYVKRSLLVPILATHDVADTDSSCPIRYTTTVPTQALGLLNGGFANEQAAKFAERLQRERPGKLADQIAWGNRLITGRQPTPALVAKDEAFIAELRGKHGLDEKKSLAVYCLMLLNTNEFAYLD